MVAGQVVSFTFFNTEVSKFPLLYSFCLGEDSGLQLPNFQGKGVWEIGSLSLKGLGFSSLKLENKLRSLQPYASLTWGPCPSLLPQIPLRTCASINHSCTDGESQTGFYSVPRSQDKKHSKCPELAEQTRHKPACAIQKLAP